MTGQRDTANSKPSQAGARTNGVAGKLGFFSRRNILLALAGMGVVGSGALFFGSTPSMAQEMVVYKNPSCGCCSKWADKLRAEGFSVQVKAVGNMSEVKEKYGTPWQMEACHTALIDGYVIEGHVPLREIKRLLAERPDATGLAVPGMPAGSLGMEGQYSDRYKVMLFHSDGSAKVYASY